MRIKVLHCLSPDKVGRVCRTAAGNRGAREAEGQVEGGLSFASFSLADKENEGQNDTVVQMAKPLNSDLALRARVSMMD